MVTCRKRLFRGGCCIHPMLCLKMSPPCVFCPSPCCEILATGLECSAWALCYSNLRWMQPFALRVAVVYDVPFRVTMRRFLKLGLQVTLVTRGNETAVAAAHTHAREAHYSWMTIAVVRATPSGGSSTNWAVTGFHQGGLR